MQNKNHPSSIHSPHLFDAAQWAVECPHCGNAVGFDGVFNWGWTQGLYTWNKKVSPMDFDGQVEHNYHYLIFETKGMNVDIPLGQLIALDHLQHAKSFTVMKIWGKNEPDQILIDYPVCIKKPSAWFEGVEAARRLVSEWVRFSDTGRWP